MVPESPREFLSNAGFKLDAIEADFPNAKRLLENGLFVSHSGKDSQRIRDEILPIVERSFALERYFFHNRQSGGAESYKQLVWAALHYCDKFFVAVSRNSIQNEWVLAEVEWAIEQKRPIVCCLLDHESAAKMHPMLRKPSRHTRGVSKIWAVEFRSGSKREQKSLAAALNRLLRL